MYISDPFIHFESPAATSFESTTANPGRSGLAPLAAILAVGLTVLVIVLGVLAGSTGAGHLSRSHAPAQAHVGR